MARKRSRTTGNITSQIDPVHERGESGGGRMSRTSSDAPRDPVAQELPPGGPRPGTGGPTSSVDDVGARMIPPSDAAANYLGAHASVAFAWRRNSASAGSYKSGRSGVPPPRRFPRLPSRR